MDTPILLAIISTSGVLITGLASIAVAVITNKRENKSLAEDSADEASKQQLAVKDERIALRDEQLRMKDAQLADCLQKSASVQGELQVALQELAEAKAEIRSRLRKRAQQQEEQTDE